MWCRYTYTLTHLPGEINTRAKYWISPLIIILLSTFIQLHRRQHSVHRDLYHKQNWCRFLNETQKVNTLYIYSTKTKVVVLCVKAHKQNTFYKKSKKRKGVAYHFVYFKFCRWQLGGCKTHHHYNGYKNYCTYIKLEGNYHFATSV